MEQKDFGVKLESIAHNSVGYFGDPEGYEELLYKTKSPRSYLLVGKGGYASRYSDVEIIELTQRQAQDYLIEIIGEEEAYKLIPQEKPVVKKPAAKPAPKASKPNAAPKASKSATKTTKKNKK
ncbi:MAG: hypothetical protein GX909_01680 [Clostridiaceae bacterium]|nr:hypothetical protein [Clostridiaceae bacterium]